MHEIQDQLDKAKQAMEKACAHTQTALAKIRAGRALPSMLDGLLVTYYVQATPIDQVAAVSTPDARTLAIKPWEKSLIAEIEKAILNSQLDLTPQNNGEIIRINIPPLTEERRKLLVKRVKGDGEKGKIAVRNIRKEVKESLKQLQKAGGSEDEIKRAEEQVQKLTNTFVGQLETYIARKETEVMDV